jgi:hypothetical protein
MPDIFVADTKTQEQEQATKRANDNKPAPIVDPIELSENLNGGVHLFSSYCEHPDDISFQNQEEDEKVLLFMRKDMITNLSWILTGLALIIIPLLITPALTYLHIPDAIMPQNWMLALSVFYYLLVTIFIFIKFITWYFNIDLVTEKRILDIELMGIVYKNVAATKLTLVQDVSYSQVGVVRTIFDYGDVLVQTAGTIDNFTFDAIPRPDDAVHVVESLIGRRHEQF